MKARRGGLCSQGSDLSHLGFGRRQTAETSAVTADPPLATRHGRRGANHRSVPAPPPSRPPAHRRSRSRLARHSQHFWSRTNQAGGEERLAPAPAMRDLSHRCMQEARRGTAELDFIRTGSPPPVPSALRDTWSSSVLFVIDQRE